jgi:hypothetical protein
MVFNPPSGGLFAPKLRGIVGRRQIMAFGDNFKTLLPAILYAKLA